MDFKNAFGQFMSVFFISKLNFIIHNYNKVSKNAFNLKLLEIFS